MEIIQTSIVEDDAGVRRELEALINAAAGFSCPQTYPDAETALGDIPRRRPDLVLMDLNLPGMSGIECARRLKQLRPALPIVMLTVCEDSDSLCQSLVAGANGYLLKRSPRPRLIEALKEICAGGAPMSRSMARKALGFFRRMSQLPAAELQALTPREEEILSGLAAGHSRDEIAVALGLGSEMMRAQTARIFEKFRALLRTKGIEKYLGA